MEVKLRANDHKGGWMQDDPLRLLTRLQEEFAELIIAFWDAVGASYREKRFTYTDEEKIRIVHEAADVANFAMMVADNFTGGLEWPKAVSTTTSK